MDELNNFRDELIEEPAMMDAILAAIAKLDIATHADVVAMNARQDEFNARIEVVEATLSELPSKYASAADVNRMASSQGEYEASRRQLTEQVGNLTLITTDSQLKLTAIESSVAELSGLKSKVDSIITTLNTFTESITVFMGTQRERVDNLHARIDNSDRDLEGLRQDQAQDVKELRNVREAVSGLDSDVNGLRGDIGATVRPMQGVVSELKAQQHAHDARLLGAEKTLIKLDTSFSTMLWFFNNPDGRKLGGVLLGIFFFTQIAALYVLYRIATAGMLAG